MTHPQFSIVLPCYNEAKNLPILLELFQPFAQQHSFELILVNNGSTDESQSVLNELLKNPSYSFARVVRIDQNIGYGHGIYTGLKQARAQVLAYSHADIQTPPEDLFRAWEMVDKENIDLSRSLIKGFRKNRSDEKNFLTKGLSIFVRLSLGVELPDINGQPKLFSKAFLETFVEPPKDFTFDTYVLYQASIHGFQIHTFDVDFKDRIHGSSSWSSHVFLRYKTIFKYMVSLLKLAWQNRKKKRNLFSWIP